MCRKMALGIVTCLYVGLAGISARAEGEDWPVYNSEGVACNYSPGNNDLWIRDGASVPTQRPGVLEDQELHHRCQVCPPGQPCSCIDPETGKKKKCLSGKPVTGYYREYSTAAGWTIQGGVDAATVGTGWSKQKAEGRYTEFPEIDPTTKDDMNCPGRWQWFIRLYKYDKVVSTPVIRGYCQWQNAPLQPVTRIGDGTLNSTPQLKTLKRVTSKLDWTYIRSNNLGCPK